MGIGKDFLPLYSTLGYEFSDIKLLEAALTHVSYTNEMKSRGFRCESNEALEFLGDAVLELIISEALFESYSDKGEGALTRMRQTLVCESTLAKIGRELSLGEYLNIGTGEETLGLRERPKPIADCLEAVIAALYLDSRARGTEEYKRVVINLFEKEMKLLSEGANTDYKTLLQQFVEKNGDSLLVYEYSESGPEHDKLFTATAFINNNKVGVGKGKTKRKAETEAAKSALKLFGIE